MAIKAHLEDHALAGDDQRSTPRRALRLETSGTFSAGGPEAVAANVTIHNMSAAGLLLETEQRLTEGEELALELPEAGTVTATVVWRSERLYGCAFATPIGPAAMAAAQLQGSAPTPGSQPLAFPAAVSPALGAGEALGMRLNRLRREAGLTLAEVAAALGVSKPTVWAWEKGKARPLPERLAAIAAALRVAPEELAAAPVAREIDSVIAECRSRIAEACGTAPEAVRIMIEM